MSGRSKSGDECEFPLLASVLSWRLKLSEEQGEEVAEILAEFPDPSRGKCAFDRCESPAERLLLAGGCIENDDGVRLTFAEDDLVKEADGRGIQLVGLLEYDGSPQAGSALLYQQFSIGPYRVDFCIPHERLIVEVDGYEFHSSKEQLTADKKRDRFLVSEGWRVLRFTGSEIYANPSACLEEILQIARGSELADPRIEKAWRDGRASVETKAAEDSSVPLLTPGEALS